MAATLASILRLFLTVLSLSLQVLIKLRLGIPLLYTVLMCTVFADWAAANNTLAVVILLALLATVALSWVVSFVRRVRAG